MFSSPLWVSGFRPFFLLGPVYGPLALVAWLSGVVPSTALWHGHEMTFGFAVAIICGFILTALPSWAGTPTVAGWRLAVLAGLWLVGRLAVWAAPWLPAAAVAAADLALLPALIVMIAPGLRSVRDRRFRALPPILAALAAGNVAFHLAALAGDPVVAHKALRWSVDVIGLLFAAVGGFLTPAFTQVAFEQLGRAGAIRTVAVIERASAVAILAWLLADTVAPATAWSGGTAAIAAVVHLVRLTQWRGWLAWRIPIIWVMHLAYLTFVVALTTQALSDLGGGWPATGPIHMFTVGALGLMMIGLMTRVALRHTGRPVLPRPVMVAGFLLMIPAAAARWMAAVAEGGLWLPLAAVLWAGPFLVYLGVYGWMLVTPSLPRNGRS